MERRQRIETESNPSPRRAGAVERTARPHNEKTQPCPRCGHAMPALKGGSASICPNCGFKDSCCY